MSVTPVSSQVLPRSCISKMPPPPPLLPQGMWYSVNVKQCRYNSEQCIFVIGLPTLLLKQSFFSMLANAVSQARQNKSKSSHMNQIWFHYFSKTAVLRSYIWYVYDKLHVRCRFWVSGISRSQAGCQHKVPKGLKMAAELMVGVLWKMASNHLRQFQTLDYP